MFFLTKKLIGLWIGKVWYWAWKLLMLWFRGFLLQLAPLVLVFLGLLMLLLVYRFC